MRRPTQRAVFKGCPQHTEFNYYCHACLVKTVGNLCDLLDQKEEERVKEALRWEQQKKKDALAAKRRIRDRHNT